MVSTEIKSDFWVPWNISDQIHRILCPKLLYFLEKMHKVFKNKAQGCCTPLISEQIVQKKKKGKEAMHYMLEFNPHWNGWTKTKLEHIRRVKNSDR